MIEYYRGLYGLGLLARVHGSALYRAAIPGALSAVIFLPIFYRWTEQSDEILDHPYAVGVLVTSVSFLIVFRANNAYQRYWEGAAAVHHMMSKWLDAVAHTGCYHLQCSHYDSIKPPSYFDHPDLNRYNLTRDRECPQDLSARSSVDYKSLRQRRRVERSIEYVQSHKKRSKAVTARQNSLHAPQSVCQSSHSVGYQLFGPARLDGGWGSLFPDDVNGPKATHYSPGDEDVGGPPIGFESTRGGRNHALFLQELAHLASLCVAVAFCTLRSTDSEGLENPVDIYQPGQPWPEVDPDKLPHEVLSFMGHGWRLVANLKYWFGLSRTPNARARHNASRPMPVIGGVSDNEIIFLQRARGASAKVTLAWSWLSEFIIREQLAGTLGKVGPPIISRIFQFLSDGMIYYNHARKIMYIPFPFPHAQLAAFFTLIMVLTIPLLMGQFTNTPWLGAALTFLTVTCLVGLHEVARELENPFRNMPNDVPLVTLLAMFNESLITMFAGYHPDHYFDPDMFPGHEAKVGSAEERNAANLKQTEAPKKAKPSPPETESKSDPPQSVEGNKAIAELHEMIRKQSEEIAQLRGMVEVKGVVS